MIGNAEWRKSSRSGEGANNCVELAVRADHTDIRDTKARAAGTLALNRNEWAAFLAAVKNEQFGG